MEILIKISLEIAMEVFVFNDGLIPVDQTLVIGREWRIRFSRQLVAIIPIKVVHEIRVFLLQHIEILLEHITDGVDLIRHIDRR